MPPDHVPSEASASVQETQFSAIPGDAPLVSEETHASSNASGYIPGRNNDVARPSYGTTGGTANGIPTSSTTVADAPKTTVSPRALSPDLLRGLLMVLQAVDHCSVSQGAWRHGVALESEQDGTVVKKWNDPVPWTARMLTHLCAPGFMFLLGMGVVYFGRSRSKLGWSSWEMLRHFAVRALVLAAVNELLFTLPFGRGRIIILNIVLLALAVNYFLAGLLWLAVNASERVLSTLLESFHAFPEEEGEQPLLQEETSYSFIKLASAWAQRCSWHLHNGILLLLTVITIAWNQWLSPHHGHCPVDVPPGYSGPTKPTTTSLGPWFDFWFLNVQYPLVVSPFPPLAWLSPAILGLLYGRILLSRQWKAYTINASNAAFGVFLMLLFVLTRLLHFGNLSEDCLRMPEQLASPGRNQYLASFRSFFYIIKYPPSFSYIAFTMSINFLLLAFFGALPERFARSIPTLLTFGQSALFFYIVHLMLYFGMGKLAKQWFGHELDHIDPMTGKPAIGTEGRPIDPSAESLLSTPSQPYRAIRINDTEYLESIALPNFSIANAWSGNETSPAWLRPVNPDTAILLLDLVISTYATRPPDGIAGYATTGPESSIPLPSLDTRVIVKQLLPSNRTRIPVAPMRNKEVAYAAQIVRYLYNLEGLAKREWAWKMCNLAVSEGQGPSRVANCTGVMMVQRDLWYSEV
ncbi:MAG: hypothetical protein Q9184_006351 [Pyrenodesmia sp. 2 TL-2023]